MLQPLAIADDSFILELVNTEGWIKFIRNRNITSNNEAQAYIHKILDNSNITYWVVTLKDNGYKIGLITYIKRDYLEHHDIGFAFLPNFYKKGYAYEASIAVLYKLVKENDLTHILAITIPENVNSIELLKKIGLEFEQEIERDNEKLHRYGASGERLKIYN